MIIISNEKEHAEKDTYVFHDKENVTWFIEISNGTSDSIICDQRQHIYFHISTILW